MPEATLNRRKYLKPDEVRRLLEAAAAAGPRAHALLYTVVNLGLRVSEAVALRWGDIGADDVMVRTSKQRTEVIDETPLPEGVSRVLAAYKEAWRVDGRRPGPRDRIWPISVRRAQGIFDEAAEAAGLKLPGRGIHCLRHTFGLVATEASGGNAVQVGKLLRHRSPGSTAVYLHTLGLAELRTKMGEIGGAG